MIKEFKGNRPDLHLGAFIADTAVVIGNVAMKEFSSLWFNTVARRR